MIWYGNTCTAPGSLEIETMVSWAAKIFAPRRTLSIENIPSSREDLSFAALVRGMRSHYQSTCKQTAESVHHMIRCNLYKWFTSWFPIRSRRKRDSLRAITTTAHIAIRVGSYHPTLYKIVTADCEKGWVSGLNPRYNDRPRMIRTALHRVLCSSESEVLGSARGNAALDCQC